MPFRRRFRRSTRARRSTRRTVRSYRRKYGRRRRTVRRAMPIRKLVKMRFATWFIGDPDIVSPFKQYSFRANSVYDPDATGIGDQPYSYDQWSTFYPTWSVIGSKITVKLLSTSGSVEIPSIIGVSLSNSATPPTGWSQDNLLEQPNVSWRLIPGIGISNPLSCSMRYSPKKWWGIGKITDNDELWGSTNSNPSYQTFFNVFVAAVDGSSNVTPLYGMVTIDYLVLFRNPNQLASS